MNYAFATFYFICRKVSSVSVEVHSYVCDFSCCAYICKSHHTQWPHVREARLKRVLISVFTLSVKLLCVLFLTGLAGPG